MMKNSNYYISSFLALLLLAPIALGKTGKAGQVGELQIEPYMFEAANGLKVDAERGFLNVPEKRGKTDSRLIKIAFIRFRSISASPKSPIVYLAGGPGSSGIATARGARFSMFMALRDVGDVIVLDQRGVGQSIPNLTCSNSLDLPLDQLASQAIYLEAFGRASKDCAKHWVDQGLDLTGYNTVENADDIEDLRRALGVSKINIVGISYGTHLGLVTLKRHRKSIERAVLAGTEGLDHTYKLPTNVQFQLEAISREIKSDADLRQKVPDFLELVKRVFDKVEKNPPVAEFNDPRTGQTFKTAIGKFDLQYLTSLALGDMPSISRLPALFSAMDHGDFSDIAPQVVAIRKRRLGSAMSYMTDCASGISKRRLRRIEREVPNTLLGTLIDFPFPNICQVWNQDDLGNNFRSSFRSKVPTLFISGTLDGRTPVKNAEDASKGFSNGRHLIIERAGHNDDLLISSPQITKTMLRFLRGEKMSDSKITLPPVNWLKF